MGRPVKTHTFNGEKYLITVDSLDGMCSTFKKERELVILADLNKQAGLITTIHESLHAENWSKKEADVERVSQEIGSFLWRLGFRKVE